MTARFRMRTVSMHFQTYIHDVLFLSQYRLVSYRVIMEWALKGETLGRGNRKPLPSCVVGAIRRRYPSESGAYVGFQEAEDAISML